MAFIDELQEAGLGARDRLDGLARTRVTKERDEVARVPHAQRDADLAIGLEAADAGAVPGAWVDHDERALGRIGRHVGGRDDAQQGVVDRLGQRARVSERFVVEHEHGRHAFALVLGGFIAALAQDVLQQDGALPRIDPIFNGGPWPRKNGAKAPNCASAPLDSGWPGCVPGWPVDSLAGIPLPLIGVGGRATRAGTVPRNNLDVTRCASQQKQA